MIMNLVLLFGFLLHQLFSNNVVDTLEGVPKDFSLRVANVDFLQQDTTLVQLFLYQEKGDKGTLIPHFDYEQIAAGLDKTRKLLVLFNGHPSADSDEPFEALRAAFFDTDKVNIILVYIDWTKHQITFLDALRLADSLGQFIGDILKDFKIPTNNFHFFGHCAGSEMGAAVAKHFKLRTGVNIPRLTVFDPFITNVTRLFFAQDYVDFVDVYHAGIYDPPFFPVGTVDFYPNAGIRQPGCSQKDVLEKFICHHRRAIYLYIESIYTKVNAIEAYFSFTQKHLRVKDNAKTATFGHMVDRYQTGTYYLPTYKSEPFLMDCF